MKNHGFVAGLGTGLGGGHHGVYGSAELEELGISRAEVRRRLRHGDLAVLRRGWYAAPGHDPVVAEAITNGGVLSCVSALKYYGFWVPPGYHRCHRRGPGGCRPYSRMPTGRHAVDSIVTALECAARCMPDDDWIVVCDSVQNTMTVSAEAVRAEMGRLPGRVLTLFAKTDRDSQSGTETYVRLRLRALHYAVVVQPKIPGVGHTDLRIGRLIIECDSKEHHTGLADYQNDRRRDRKATVGGYLTFRLTYADVLYGWDEVLADIRSITDADRHRRRVGRKPSR
ncbi:MAG: hypothetical protein QM774_08420 [Gordonia sp. (in: high G+C Gram-positive bacteria)]|uniref:hypothetical protein n=1 Tax=Gordonia sp. (in: high G+C Gram-positive bacteria) TaxID=84139 RepID=UPI0039E41F3B